MLGNKNIQMSCFLSHSWKERGKKEKRKTFDMFHSAITHAACFDSPTLFLPCHICLYCLFVLKDEVMGSENWQVVL